MTVPIAGIRGAIHRRVFSHSYLRLLPGIGKSARSDVLQIDRPAPITTAVNGGA
jgi:hypothetical protein